MSKDLLRSLTSEPDGAAGYRAGSSVTDESLTDRTERRSAAGEFPLTARDPLIRALTELNGLLLDEIDPDEVIQRLCERTHEMLELTGCGVIQIGEGELRVSHATDLAIRALEIEQAVLADRPAAVALSSGQMRWTNLTDSGGSWPRFAAAALDAGAHLVCSVPLAGGDESWGVLDLYCGAGGLSVLDAEAAQILADAASVLVRSARERQITALAEEHLRRQLLHDPLTGLPNRVLLLDRLQHALRAISRRSRSLAALFVDLDGFKQVNDRHGHRTGDLLLKVVAERLTSTLRPTDTLARLGGDEFVVVCEDLHVPSPSADHDLTAVGRRILEVLRVPMVIDGVEFQVDASVGAVWANDEDDSADVILHDADLAMYHAKRAGGARVAVSDRSSYSTLASTIRTETSLYEALGRHELRLHYQPIVPLAPGGPEGVEALLRWEHRDRGLLLPVDFLAAAERTGLILPIGIWALEEACCALVIADTSWTQMSVNVSAVQLRGETFVADVVSVLERTGVEAASLILEVTENVLVTGNEAMSRSLRDLADLGVDIAIDDFGTGYSSFAYLKQLPATIIKIDRLFVAGLGNDPRDLAIVRGITTMAHELGLRVIAEGAETEEQCDLLRDAGCDAAQGWVLGRPEERLAKL